VIAVDVTPVVDQPLAIPGKHVDGAGIRRFRPSLGRSQ
jgi:hypothetical protein